MRHSWILVSLLFTIPAFSAEHWEQTGSHRFGVFTSLMRTQGMANDGQGNFWFSANQYLSRTRSLYTWLDAASNLSPFDHELLSNGANHIGDVDYYRGRLYAGIEDGHDYFNPFIGVYNAETLRLESHVRLPHDWQPDGVPWVAVDSGHGHLISAQYSHTTMINLYDLRTIQPVGRIPLSHELNSIQGGKVLGDALYMTANDFERGFGIYRMSLASGEVEEIGKLPDGVHEVEGLMFVPEADGFVLHVLAVTGHGLSTRMTMFDFRESSENK